jgi:hypothetical protein
MNPNPFIAVFTMWATSAILFAILVLKGSI